MGGLKILPLTYSKVHNISPELEAYVRLKPVFYWGPAILCPVKVSPSVLLHVEVCK